MKEKLKHLSVLHSEEHNFFKPLLVCYIKFVRYSILHNSPFVEEIALWIKEDFLCERVLNCCMTTSEKEQSQ